MTFSLTLLGVSVDGSSATVVISLSEPGQALGGAQIVFQMPQPQRQRWTDFGSELPL